MSHSKPRKPNDYHEYLLPSDFDAAAIVGPLKADAARWLVSTILHKLAVRDVDARRFAILSSTILERVMGHGYATIVRALVDAGVLLRSPYHEGRSFGYRLADEYLAGMQRLVTVTNPVIRDRLQRERERHDAEQAERRLPIHDALDEAQQALTVLPAAHDAVELLPRESRLCQRVHVDRLERGELPLTISTTQRLFNGLSGVKSGLREHVRLDGEPIGCVDIRNSQPALLGNLVAHGFPLEWVKRCSSIKIHRWTSAPPPSLSAFPSPALAFAPFASVAASGILYDELAEAFGGDRKFVKKRFLVDVLAKKGTYRSKVEDEFRFRFPEAWETIQKINGSSHCNLIRLLQRLEAWLVIERIAPKLVERLPIVTLHDAIYAAVHDLGQVEDAFRETLEEVGWQLALKVEVNQMRE